MALCAAAFMFIAAPIYMNQTSYPLFINGQRFGNALTVNGVLALPVEDVAKALSGTPNLQLAGLKISGPTLTLLPAVQAGGERAGKVRSQDFHFVMKQDKASPTLKLLLLNGKPYVALTEVAKLFGGAYSGPTTNVRPGQSIQLNFTANPNAIIAVR